MSATTETVNAQTNGTESAPETQAPAVVEGSKVYVGNLPFKTTKEELTQFVSKSGGDIVDVTLPMKFKRPAGHGFITYKTDADAQKAIQELNDNEFQGRKLIVRMGRTPEEQAARVQASKEKREAEKAERAAEKKAAGGETTAVEEGEGEAKTKKKRSSKSKRTSRRRVPGEGEEETAEADGQTPANGEAVEGAEVAEKPKRKSKPRKPREARIDGAEEDATDGAATTERKPRERKPRQPRLELTGEQSTNTIFVANLPFSVDDEALASIFTNLSIRVKSAKVIQATRRIRGGKPFRSSKGFGFVEVEDPAQQKEAVEKVEGSLVGDRTISAKVANEMRPVEVEAVSAEGGAEGAKSEEPVAETAA